MSAHRISPSGKAGAHTHLVPATARSNPQLMERDRVSSRNFRRLQGCTSENGRNGYLTPFHLLVSPSKAFDSSLLSSALSTALLQEASQASEQRGLLAKECRAQTSLHVPSSTLWATPSPCAFVLSLRREALSPAGKVRNERLPGGGQQGKLLGVRTGEGLSRQREEPRPEQLLILCPPHTEPSPCSRCLAQAIPSPAHGHAVGSAGARI